jgi:hypothetical protein
MMLFHKKYISLFAALLNSVQLYLYSYHIVSASYWADLMRLWVLTRIVWQFSTTICISCPVSNIWSGTQHTTSCHLSRIFSVLLCCRPSTSGGIILLCATILEPMMHSLCIVLHHHLFTVHFLKLYHCSIPDFSNHLQNLMISHCSRFPFLHFGFCYFLCCSVLFNYVY